MWTHSPVAASQESVVQASPSSQAAAPSPRKVHWPVAGSQESAVQASPSSHTTGVETQAPSSQASPVVHASPSSQSSGAPPHWPLAQTSPVVQASSSSQAAALSSWAQAPVSGSQTSSVQGSASSQPGAT